MAVLRRAEDAYVDDLIADAPEQGVTLLKALFPRAYLDLNRIADDIDPALIDGDWPQPLRPGPKSAMGIGLIRQVVVPGAKIYARRLTVAEVQRRIETYYRPYHEALADILNETRSLFGTVWLVDWHSMKSTGNAATPDGEGASRADAVIGDLEGSACDPAFTDLAASTLRGLGYSVTVNEPYSGGEILHRYTDPRRGIHGLQIEINRALYLDEKSVRPTAGFEPLRKSLEQLTHAIGEFALSQTRAA